jgi:hypothetical protein
MSNGQSEEPVSASGGPVPSILLTHKDLTRRDDTIYLTGHAYINCHFERCTLVLTGFPFACVGCSFADCVFHVNVVIHDRQGLENLRSFFAIIEGCLQTTGVNAENQPNLGVVSWQFDHQIAPQEGPGQ